MKYLIVWAVSCAAGAGLMHTITISIEREPETPAAARYFNYKPLPENGKEIVLRPMRKEEWMPDAK